MCAGCKTPALSSGVISFVGLVLLGRPCCQACAKRLGCLCEASTSPELTSSLTALTGLLWDSWQHLGSPEKSSSIASTFFSLLICHSPAGCFPNRLVGSNNHACKTKLYYLTVEVVLQKQIAECISGMEERRDALAFSVVLLPSSPSSPNSTHHQPGLSLESAPASVLTSLSPFSPSLEHQFVWSFVINCRLLCTEVQRG